MKITASKRMEIFKPAIFGKLKEAANKKRENGGNIVDLSLGSPDLPPAKIIREKLAEQSLLEANYGYTLGGIPRFNEAVARYYEQRVSVLLDPETEVLQTMGSQEGLIHLPMAFCDEGDVVLTTNPAYVAYDTGIKLAGALPYRMPLLKENGFLPDIDAIPEEIAAATKLMILNLPGNPVPAMPTPGYFEKVVAFAKEHEIIVLHDAAYSEYYFTGEAPFSFLSTPGAMEVGLETNSLSKSFSLAGARIAYLAGNKDAIQILRGLKTNLDYGTFKPIQEAAIIALDHAEEITAPLREEFTKRHQILMAGLEELGWEATPSTGGMFIWAKYPGNLDDISFAFKAIEEAGVVMVPGSAFGSEGAGYVRIALVQNEATLKQAIEQLKDIQI